MQNGVFIASSNTELAVGGEGGDPKQWLSSAGYEIVSQAEYDAEAEKGDNLVRIPPPEEAGRVSFNRKTRRFGGGIPAECVAPKNKMLQQWLRGYRRPADLCGSVVMEPMTKYILQGESAEHNHMLSRPSSAADAARGTEEAERGTTPARDDWVSFLPTLATVFDEPREIKNTPEARMTWIGRPEDGFAGREVPTYEVERCLRMPIEVLWNTRVSFSAYPASKDQLMSLPVTRGLPLVQEPLKSEEKGEWLGMKVHPMLPLAILDSFGPLRSSQAVNPLSGLDGPKRYPNVPHDIEERSEIVPEHLVTTCGFANGPPALIHKLDEELFNYLWLSWRGRKSCEGPWQFERFGDL